MVYVNEAWMINYTLEQLDVVSWDILDSACLSVVPSLLKILCVEIRRT